MSADKDVPPPPVLEKIHAHVGFLGLGAMGSPMARNVQAQLSAGYVLYVFDVNKGAVAAAVAHGAEAMDSPADMAACCDVVVSMLPNDKVLQHVVTHPETGLLSGATAIKPGLIHIGCSTVHPDTSRTMAALHTKAGGAYIGAPVFARADGVAARAASLVVGGDAAVIAQVRPVLESMAQGIHIFSDDDKSGDAGAGNVVKLAGNFMIAAAIESCAEACALATGSGLDQVAVMDMLTSTIFDCLIYKGYGMRTAHRQHIPGQPLVGPGFGLALGLKDVRLARNVAAQSNTPLPLASLLEDRFVASAAKGRSALDWSALALLAAEDAGQDVSAWLPGGAQAAAAGDPTAPV